MAATQADYNIGTAALEVYEQQTIKDLNIPAVLLPSQDRLNTYAAAAAKIVIDALDAQGRFK